MTKFNATDLEVLNKVQLRELCRDNGIGYNGMNNEGMRAALMLVPGGDAEAGPSDSEVPVSEQPATEQPVEGAAEVPVPQPTPVELPPLVNPPVPVSTGRKIQANRPEQYGVKRPSAGTKCAQIWAWCDEVHNAGDVVRAKELRAALPALDDTTKTVQFYRWRKFNGIQGRV